MEKAAVTGATGFLGAHLACMLRQKGFDVVCLHRSDRLQLFQNICKYYNLSPADFTWKLADVLDTDTLDDALAGADVVFHCAARISFFSKDSSALFETNAEGTRNVCNICLRHSIPLIFSSSVAALGRKSGNGEMTEDSEWVESKYNSDYAISKHLAELEVWRAANEGLDTCIVNPGVILGPGDGETGSNAVFSHVKSGSRFYPSGSNGFVGVQDVCKAMISAWENKVFGKRILLVSENLSYKKLLCDIAEFTHSKPPNKELKGLLLKSAIAVARFCEFFRIPFPFPAQGLISTSGNSVYKPQNTGLLPGFQFTPITQVLTETCSLLYQ